MFEVAPCLRAYSLLVFSKYLPNNLGSGSIQGLQSSDKRTGETWKSVFLPTKGLCGEECWATLL